MDAVQLSLQDYMQGDEHSIELFPEKPQNTDCPHALAFDFEKIFTERDFEEIHNENSMAIHGNSLEVLKKMKDKSVNLIFADAPYGIGKNFGNDSDK